MTKAKRYEEERKRSDIWHSRMQSVAWDYKSKGLIELLKIADKKFNVWAVVEYDATEMVYNVVCEIGPAGPMGHLPPRDVLLFHCEEYHLFPSDHLKTKLLLMVG